MSKKLFCIILFVAGLFATAADAANQITAADVTGVRPGDTFELVFTMQTDFQYTAGYQFAITLPDGFSFAKSRNRYQTTFTDTDFTVDFMNNSGINANDDQIYVFIVSSQEVSLEEQYGYFEATTPREICRIKVTAGADVAAGDYSFVVSNVRFSEIITSTNTVSTGSSESTYTSTVTVEVPSYKLVLNGTEYEMTATADEGVYVYNTADKIAANAAGHSVLVTYDGTQYGGAAITRQNSVVTLAEGAAACTMESDEQAAYYGFTLTVSGESLSLAVDYSGQYPTGMSQVEAAAPDKYLDGGHLFIRKQGRTFDSAGKLVE